MMTPTSPRRLGTRGATQNGAKALGAFYTSDQIADFLAWWAIRSGTDTVLDPCFGVGVFLRSACERLIALRGKPGTHVFGVEIVPKVHQLVRDQLARDYGLNHRNLRLADFFRVEPNDAFRVDAVIGNPP